MPNYQKMYYELFHAITDALDALAQDDVGAATQRLKQAQCAAEEIYINSADEPA